MFLVAIEHIVSGARLLSIYVYKVVKCVLKERSARKWDRKLNTLQFSTKSERPVSWWKFKITELIIEH